MPSPRWRWALWSALALFLLHAATYGRFVSDDAFISLRYARMLLAGEGLVWNPGTWVEGYSNPAWVLLTAGLGQLGCDLVWAARLLGLASGLGTIALVWRWAGGRRAGAAAAAPALLLAAAPPLAVWSVGGLEANLVALCLTGALTMGLPRPGWNAGRNGTPPEPMPRAWYAGLWLALLLWTRPDGALLAGLVGLAIWLCHGDTGRGRMLRAAVPPAVGLVALLVARRILYGEWVPNTAYIKAGPGLDLLARGWHRYVLPGLLGLAGATGMLVLAWLAPPRRRAGALTLVAGLWCAYVAVVGGDIFPGRRHMLPLVVCGALAAAHLLAHAWLAHRPGAGVRWLGTGLAAVATLSLLLASFLDPENQRARSERWEHDGLAVGRTLCLAFGEGYGHGPLLAASAAGAVPYASGLPTVDMLGLNDRHIAQQPRQPGHMLAHDRTDMDYVLGRSPELIAFGPPPAMLTSGFPPYQAVQDRESFFADHDVLPVFGLLAGEEPPAFRYGALWLRRDGPLGIRRLGDRWVVPGHLFTTVPGRLGFVDGQGIQGDAIYGALARGAGRSPQDAGLAATAEAGAVGLFLVTGRYPARHRIPPGRYGVEVETVALPGLAGGSARILCGGRPAVDGVLQVVAGEPLQLEVAPRTAVKTVTLTPVR